MRGNSPKSLLLVAIVATLLFSCVNNSKYISISGYAQGGKYTVKLNTKGVKKKPKQIAKDIDSIFTAIDNTFSGYNKSSLLSCYNRGEQLQLNDMFKELYATSFSLYKETKGAFNISCGLLYELWGFGFSGNTIPNQKEIKEVLSKMERAMPTPDVMENLGIGDLGKRLKLNFNAIAQGYTCDKIASYLYSIGVKDMLIDMLEIYCAGVNPQGKAWKIGIDTPIEGSQKVGEKISGIWESFSEGEAINVTSSRNGGSSSLVGKGLATSGNYRKFYIKNGKKYAHIIDPRTGHPVEHNLLSATIEAPNATIADAYATYCMVIGLEEAKKFINSTENIEAFLIYEGNGEMHTWYSSGFNVKINDENLAKSVLSE